MAEGRFSRRYGTYDDWNRAVGDSSYANRIRRVHAQYPDRNLSALRVSSLSGIPIPRRNYNALTAVEQSDRVRALDVLKLVRKGRDFSTATDEVGISPEKAMTHLGSVLGKNRGGEITGKAKDTISRGLVIYATGKKTEIVVNRSRQASLIGQYHSAVGRYLEGDRNALKPFKGVKIVDENGRKYELETDPDRVEAIKEAEEDRETFEIYSGGA